MYYWELQDLQGDIMALHKIVVTGALGQIAYSLIFRLLSGELLGEDIPFDLALLDIESLENQFPGLIMEIEDSGSSCLRSVSFGSNPETAFLDASIVFLIGAKPRRPGMERKDLLAENGQIFQRQGRALNTRAVRDVKVLVVGNPCHTNCLIAQKNAPELLSSNFCAMSALDEFRARGLVAQKIGCPVSDIGPVAIWGNHSSTLVPDSFTSIHIPSGKKIGDIVDHTWLQNDYIWQVQQRGAEVLKARGKSSAASAANSALMTMKFWLGRGDSCLSIGRLAIGNPYGIDERLVFSFPTLYASHALTYAVSDWPTISSVLIDKVRQSEKELLEERMAVEDLLR